MAQRPVPGFHIMGTVLNTRRDCEFQLKTFVETMCGIVAQCAESYIDDDFVYKRKIGFHLPIARWLRDKNNLGRYFDLVTDNIFRQRGFYNPRFVSKAVDEHLKEVKDYSKSLSFIIHLEIWHRMFIDKHATSGI